MAGHVREALLARDRIERGEQRRRVLVQQRMEEEHHGEREGRPVRPGRAFRLGEGKPALFPCLAVPAKKPEHDSAVGGDRHQRILAAGQPVRLRASRLEQPRGRFQMPARLLQPTGMEHADAEKAMGGDPAFEAPVPLGAAKQILGRREGRRDLGAHEMVAALAAGDLDQPRRVAELLAQGARPLIDAAGLRGGVAVQGRQRGPQFELQSEFAPVPLRRLRQSGQRLQRPAQMGRRLGHRRTGDRALAGGAPTADGLLGHAGPGEVLRQQLGPRFRDVRRQGLDRLRDRRMQLPPPREEQRAIGRIQHQRVLEREGGMRRHAGAEHEARLRQPVQQLAQLGLRPPRNGSEQLVGELPADRGADLGDLPGRAEPVQARHQGAMQGGRHGGARQRRGGERSAHVGLLRIGLDHRPGELLDEERHTRRALDDLLDHPARERRIARNALDQGRRVVPPEPAERQRRDMRQSGPGRPELGPEGDKEQRRQAPEALNRHAQQFQGRRVDPVRILEQDEDGLPRREAGELRQQGREQPLAPPLRVERRQGRPAAGDAREPEQIGDQRHIILARRSPDEQRLELAEPRFRRFAALESRRTRHLRDNRGEGAVLMMRRAEVPQPGVRLAGESLHQRGGEPRLADPRLARQQDHPALAGHRLLPAAPQQLHFLVPANQRSRGGGGVDGFGAAADGRAPAQHPPGSHAPWQALRL